MRQFSIWVVAILITQVIGGHCASPELLLPHMTINGTVYTNVVVSPSSAERVMVRHGAGLGTVRIADLSLDVRRQLAEEGIITGVAAKEALSPKKKSTSRWGWKAGTAVAVETGDQNTDGEEISLAQSLRTRFENEVRAFGFGHFDVEKFLSTLSLRLGMAILGGLAVVYIVRCWCLFRICQRATGRGSILVFVPLVRWFPLAEAAKMSRHWLVVPLFGLAGFYLPPSLPSITWLPLAYVTVVAALWLTTLILFAVWCVRICKALHCSSFFGLLLFLPVLEWLALPYLAFSGQRSEEKFSLKPRTLAI